MSGESPYYIDREERAKVFGEMKEALAAETLRTEGIEKSPKYFADSKKLTTDWNAVTNFWSEEGWQDAYRNLVEADPTIVDIVDELAYKDRNFDLGDPVVVDKLREILRRVTEELDRIRPGDGELPPPETPSS